MAKKNKKTTVIPLTEEVDMVALAYAEVARQVAPLFNDPKVEAVVIEGDTVPDDEGGSVTYYRFKKKRLGDAVAANDGVENADYEDEDEDEGNDLNVRDTVAAVLGVDHRGGWDSSEPVLRITRGEDGAFIFEKVGY